MLRLTKYEIRKNIMGIVVLISVIAGLEAYLLISLLTESREHTAISTALLVLATVVAYFCTFIFGVSSYSKELNSKSSYLTFMTPVSSFGVIGSKLLSTLSVGIFFAVVLVLLAMLDMALVQNVFPETQLFSDFLDILFDMAGYEAAEFWLAVLATVIEMLVSFFGIIAMAYLAITLSSTAFQNKKYKGFISVAIFIAIVLIVSKIGDFLPEIYTEVNSVSQTIIASMPAILYFVAIIIISLFASAKLLDKKVSL